MSRRGEVEGGGVAPKSSKVELEAKVWAKSSVLEEGKTTVIPSKDTKGGKEEEAKLQLTIPEGSIPAADSVRTSGGLLGLVEGKEMECTPPCRRESPRLCGQHTPRDPSHGSNNHSMGNQRSTTKSPTSLWHFCAFLPFTRRDSFL